MNAVDTNVLNYSWDPRDPRKRSIALELIRSLPNGYLPWQVACEYVANYRKLAPYGFTVRTALDELGALRRVWATRYPGFRSLSRATELMTTIACHFGTRS